MSTAPRRRILLVTNVFGWAGAERQLEHLATGLARNGHQVVLLAIGKRWVDLSEVEATGVWVVTLGVEGKLGKLRALRQIVRYARWAELVHCTGWDATLWGRLAAIIARRPVAFTEHSPGRRSQVDSSDGKAGTGTIALHNRLLDRFTAAAIIVGAWQREMLEGEGVRPEAIVHVPNGVPIAAMREQAAAGPGRASIGVAEEALLVVQVARFAPQKGQRTALRALAEVRERVPGIELAFVGGGFEEDEVKREVEASGVDWVHFLGFRDDVAAVLRLADLSVLPSTAEGLPMTLIEAAAVGTPIVATAVGDVGWFLETTGAGIAVAAGDEAAFATACEEVLGSAPLRERLSAAATAGASAFDAATMVERYEEVFRAAIESKPLPSDG
jgi:glycosyltransferase involved in cell wall biosynthesis